MQSNVVVKNVIGLLSLIETPKFKLKLRGEVRTDPILIDQILDHIPESQWKSGGLFLDPCCGRGTFLLKIIERLKPYHSSKSIINMIYGVDIDEWCVYTTKLVIARELDAQSDDIHIGCGDFITTDFGDMIFDVTAGNPPYQPPKTKEGKGPSGDNGLYLKFINKSLSLTRHGGYIAMVNPPAGLTKSTVNGTPTDTMSNILKYGTPEVLNLDSKKYFPTVGSQICYWVMEIGKHSDTIKIVSDNVEHFLKISEVNYLPPKFNMIEHQIFNKIINNTTGKKLIVTRGVSGRDYTMTRMGYPKIQKGGNNILGFDSEHAEFMMSQLGLWLLNYISRHDSFIYHKLLTGIIIPEEGFNLSDEEEKFINSRHWPNFSSKN